MAKSKTSTSAAPTTDQRLPAKEAAESAPAAKAVEAAPVAEGENQNYRVTLGTDSLVVSARDEDEAWALYCDSRQDYPNRRFVKPEITPA